MQARLPRQQRPQLWVTAVGLQQGAGRISQPQHALQHGLQLLLATCHVLRHCIRHMQPCLNSFLIPLQHQQRGLAVPDQGFEQALLGGLQQL